MLDVRLLLVVLLLVLPVLAALLPVVLLMRLELPEEEVVPRDNELPEIETDEDEPKLLETPTEDTPM